MTKEENLRENALRGLSIPLSQVSETAAQQSIGLYSPGAIQALGLSERSTSEQRVAAAEATLSYQREQALRTALEMMRGTPLATDWDSHVAAARAYVAFLTEG